MKATRIGKPYTPAMRMRALLIGAAAGSRDDMRAATTLRMKWYRELGHAIAATIWSEAMQDTRTLEELRAASYVVTR